MNERKNIEKLIKDVNVILNKYEDRIPKIKGISNLSRGDLEDILYRAEAMLEGPYRFCEILNENIKSLFAKYNVDPEYNNKSTSLFYF